MVSTEVLGKYDLTFSLLIIEKENPIHIYTHNSRWLNK